LVAEKILSGDEPLPMEWAVSGTTGYDFLNEVSRLLVAPAGLAALRENYERLTDEDATAAEVAYESKSEVLEHSLASEVSVLANRLTRIAQQHRASRDFTRPALERALREVIACLPVYRTYVRPRGWEISEADFRHVSTAVRWAKRRNPGAAHAVFDFIGQVLRLEHPPTLSPEQADARRQFALKVQQVTGPAMAKGLEDTAFYRYYPLASLNEVGGELDARPLAVDEFHLVMTRRAELWPHSMSASGTHDTKRGEDFRARLHVLSEIPDAWVAAVERWDSLVKPMLPEVEGEAAPDRNELYLLWQTLVGTWPGDLGGDDRAAYCERIAQYMQKALREAKRHTSWMSPSADYESTVATVVRQLLVDDDGAAFRADLAEFVGNIVAAGYVNGLAQLVLKTMLPGVPDFYQGSEFWDFNLVDPDNRRPVDFDQRRASLAELQRRFDESPADLVAELGDDLPDHRAKQFAAWRLLATRAAHPNVVAQGSYLPLAVTGESAAHVVAFAREFQGDWIAAIVPRQIQCLLNAAGHVPWSDARVELPPNVAQWRNEFSGESVANGGLALMLKQFPVALLTGQSRGTE
jgi:(1->4)-alpha-D-glucan 1-alpha-D-glucosylmutase